ncbi:sensor histidine kinase [Methylorubrum extorquens]|uniref:sensor histidine kinase n=1 Tax=Methylorubrum extorquens TaxID=408 RepID=UPI001EE61C2A|nr:PAS domain-containing protein [Methylorubrum extorquens]MCG5249488.1 PAS domain-containing protein [Methylorubrum extorquens]
MPQNNSPEDDDRLSQRSAGIPSLRGCPGSSKPASLDDLLAAVVRQSQVFIGIADKNLRPVFVNAAGRKMIGLSSDDDLSAIPISDFFYAADQVLIRDIGLPTLLRNGHWEGEVRFRHFSGGSGITVRLRAFTLYDESGGIIGAATISTDISARKLAEARLCASEERLQAAIDLVGLSTYSWDPQTGALDWDARLKALWGLPPDAPVDEQVWLSAIHPDDRPRVEAAVERCTDPAGDGVYHIEYRVIGIRDGVERWVSTHGRTSFKDGRPVSFVGVVVEITTQMRAEAALRESEERFRALVNLVPVILWRSDASGLTFSENQSFLDYTGQTAEDVQDFGWLEPIHPHDRKPVRDIFVDGIETKQPIGAQFRLRCHDNRYRWFLSRQVPIVDRQERVTEWFGAAMDIHELLELQQRQTVLVDELQHRTRNLLTVVRSIAQQTMARTGPTELFREQFNDRLAALSRVQGLLSRSDQEPITIRKLIQTELDALGLTVLGKRITLEGPRVTLRKASVQTLALALHELATNARKYGALASGQGELWISWDTYTTEAGEPRLSLMWLEEGISGPQEDSPIRYGYGRELIEKALPYALKAHTSYELSEAELRCAIDLPLSAPAATSGP